MSSTCQAGSKAFSSAGPAELVHRHVDQAPWLDCHRDGARVSVADLTEARDRWPRSAETVAGRGTFRAAHPLPLRLRDRAVGALLLLTPEPGAMGPAELLVGQSLADVATIGFPQAQTIRRAEALAERLQAPVDGRHVIEQAKGVVRQHSNLTLDSALDRLRRYALARNLRPSQVARDIVEGRLDPAALTSELMRNDRT